MPLVPFIRDATFHTDPCWTHPDTGCPNDSIRVTQDGLEPISRFRRKDGTLICAKCHVPFELDSNHYDPATSARRFYHGRP